MKGKPDVDFNQVFRESGIPETEEEIATLFHEDVQKTGLITNTSPMSPFWRLILTIVIRPVQWLRDALVDVVLPGMFVATADRSLLLLHAHDVNITPKPASKASGVIWFAKTRANDDVLIPEGTIVQTARI
ncbi:TPA: baseplate J/gp47 family protein, partial [Escherichia coli]